MTWTCPWSTHFVSIGNFSSHSVFQKTKFRTDGVTVELARRIQLTQSLALERIFNIWKLLNGTSTREIREIRIIHVFVTGLFK